MRTDNDETIGIKKKKKTLSQLSIILFNMIVISFILEFTLYTFNIFILYFRPKTSLFHPDLLEALQKKFQPDIELYDFAKQLNRKQILKHNEKFESTLNNWLNTCKHLHQNNNKDNQEIICSTASPHTRSTEGIYRCGDLKKFIE